MNLSAWPYPRTLAHRGAGKLAPENTLAALRHGVALGYRGVEFDVKLAGDGTSFLMHDDTLERTTNGRGRASAFTWGELARLDAGSWHGPAYAGEPVPSYAAVARYCMAQDIAVNCEIKPSPGEEARTGAAVALDTQRHFAEAAVPPLLSSFSTEALLTARQVAPQIPRAHLFTHPLPADWLERCRAVRAIALDCNWLSIDEALVRACREAQLHLVGYTCNEPEAVERLLGWGVASIITDAIDRIPFQGAQR